MQLLADLLNSGLSSLLLKQSTTCSMGEEAGLHGCAGVGEEAQGNHIPDTPWDCHRYADQLTPKTTPTDPQSCGSPMELMGKTSLGPHLKDWNTPSLIGRLTDNDHGWETCGTPKQVFL